MKSEDLLDDDLLTEAIDLLRQKRRQYGFPTTTTVTEAWWLDRTDEVLRQWDAKHPEDSNSGT